MGIPNNGALVIKARTAEGRAENGAAVVVAENAGFRYTVMTPTAGFHVTRSVTSAHVNLSERWSRQSGKYSRMSEDRVRDALPTDEAGRDKYPGVSFVEMRARGADLFSAVLA